MHFESVKKGRIICIAAILAVLLLIPSVSSAPYFVTADLGSVYTYQGTDVQYIKAVDVTNPAISEMWIDSANTKTIGSPMIGSVQRVFSSVQGTTHGVTVTVNGGADTTVNYNRVLNDYVQTQLGLVPLLHSAIPGTTTDNTDGVFLLSRANDSVRKNDVSSKNDLILLQEASYIYVAPSPNRAVLYKSVNPPPTRQGAISEGANPFYNENNFGQTITNAGNIFDLNGYSSIEPAEASVTTGQYSAVAMSYDNVDTFSIWGYVPTVILNGDRTITWNGAAVPASYTRNSGAVTLSFNTNADITNISYVIIKSTETYDAKVTVDTDKLADHITTQWDSLSGTAPVMSNVLNKIILDGVGVGASDPYTYAIKTSTATSYPTNAITWSQIAITSGYGISGYDNSNSVIVANAALNSLTAGTYYIYAFATDNDLNPVAFDRQTIVVKNPVVPVPTSSGGGGGGGGGGGFAPSGGTIEVSTTTGILDSNVVGDVLTTAQINSADGEAELLVPAGTTALDRNDQPLKDITIQRIAASSAPPAPTTGTSPTGTRFAFNDMYYECQPTGATFSPPISLTFKLTEEQYYSLGEGESFSVQVYNEVTGLWEDIPTYINPNTFEVIADVSHFSVYALMVKQTGEIQPGTTTATSTVSPTGSAAPGETTAVPGGEEGTSIWIWALVIVIILVIIGAGWWYYNNKQET